jgi:hypothetical protein
MPYFRYSPPGLLNESTTGCEIEYTVQEVKQIYNKSHEIDESFEFKRLSRTIRPVKQTQQIIATK